MKYSALPKPVRNALGTVPRHRLLTGLGPERIERRVWVSVVAPDCWTRVFRRSAGWRRTAEEMPEPRPARKWNVGWAFLLDAALTWVEETGDVFRAGEDGIDAGEPWDIACEDV